MLNLKQTAIFAIAIGSASVAQASTADAWKELYTKASAACIKASALAGAKLRAESANFDGAVLLVIDGRHPNGMSGTAYCLYDKVTAKTQTAPAELSSEIATPKPAPATGRTCWTEGYGAPMKSAKPLGSPCRARDSDGESYFGVVKP
ncbi:MAG: hypothetical protein K2Y05_01145 [Hyphomicrobiaceae bacterium]|nr:hypothetical protein [Hyphomicrobiaceae bacterium]